jgi:hypothetical protein
MTVPRSTTYKERFSKTVVISDDVTAGELWALREALEKDAASLLGHMLFELSRLDLNLGLCLAWMDGGANLTSRSKMIEGMNLKSRLDDLRKHVDAKLPLESEPHRAYVQWIERVDSIRQVRNNFVHGRWGVEPHKNKVVNITGLPTGEQKSVEYAIDELAAINDDLCDLQRELSRLRKNLEL